MHAQHVVRVANAGGLEQVAVVSGERVGEERLAHVRSPNGQYAVALRVGVLQRGVLPLFAARARRTDGVRVVVDVHEVDVSDGGVADALARLGLEQRLELGLLAVRVDGEHLLRLILVGLAAYAAQWPFSSSDYILQIVFWTHLLLILQYIFFHLSYLFEIKTQTATNWYKTCTIGIVTSK